MFVNQLNQMFPKKVFVMIQKDYLKNKQFIYLIINFNNYFEKCL